ncbi:MAG TPA: hypothetical protein VK217_04835 [Acidimicrobiales bacterium]|nr:hypothetical protein [Acidimicrobiales bacterium]
MSIVVSMFAVVVALVVFGAMAFVGSTPPAADYTQGHQPGQPVNVTLQTVGSIGYGVHPDWVSYLAEAPGGQWVHTTLLKLPAHSKINVTILQYDSGSPLRNAFFGQVQGTSGGDEFINGKPTRLVNSNAGNGVAHTFSVPALDINVPLLGVDPSASNFCSTPAPCGSAEHYTVQFSFVTPGPGDYRFQCFIPCGLGYLYGNGGPMSTIGYMGGFLEVTA